MKSFGGGFRRSGSTIDSSQLNDPTSSIAFTGASKNPWQSIMNQMKDNVKTQLSAQNLLNAAQSGVDKFLGGDLGSASAQINTFDTSVFDRVIDTTLSSSTKQELLRKINITSDHNMYYNSVAIDPHYDREHRYENPFQFNSSVISSFNNYKFIYKEAVAQEGPMYEIKKEGAKDSEIVNQQIYMAATPSLFNANYAVPARCLMPNVPNVFISGDGETTFSVTTNSEPNDKEKQSGLTPDDKIVIKLHTYDNGSAFGTGANITDCSIKELVKCSKTRGSVLGAATYRYADFMYCKDLGKVSNNHLITLRKFSTPVGDNIFYKSAKDSDDKAYRGAGGQTGKLVAWFGTGENSLEDIMKYEMEATWRKLTAERHDVESQEDDPARGPLGKLINTLGGGSYNRYQANGFAGQHSLLTDLGAKIKLPIIGTLKGAPDDLSQRQNSLRSYDKNKVYEPINRIWDTHVYEGKLIFSHEFTLKFSYTLRSYDNVNPKAAFLDLIGNILRVTYKDGKFWGGSVNFVGPPKNSGAWNKANHMIDRAWDKVGGFLDALFNGDVDFGRLMGSVANAVQNMANGAVELAKNIKDGKGAEIIRNMYGNVKSFIQEKNIDGALKGMLKNTLGRPAVYAIPSLLTGEDVGLWHVTIGNPKNPIAAFGNLILTKASIQHSGPLGVDDFPTNITVTCTLKHARSRDAAAISRMYTRGAGQLYMGLAAKKMSKFYKSGNESGSAAALDSAQEAAMKAAEDAANAEYKDIKAMNEKEKANASSQSSNQTEKKWSELSDSEKKKYKDESDYNNKQKQAKGAADKEAKAKADKQKNDNEANYAAYKERTLIDSGNNYSEDINNMAKEEGQYAAKQNGESGYVDYFSTNGAGEYDPNTIYGEFLTDNVKLISAGYIDQNTL